MLEEIDDLKAWKRSILPNRTDRGSTIMLHQLHYHEELLDDIGEETCLKEAVCCGSSCWYELIQPYLPVDYSPLLRQDAAEEAGFYQGLPPQLRGHSEGNGYVVTVYAVCCLMACASMTSAAVVFIYGFITHTGLFKFLDD